MAQALSIKFPPGRVVEGNLYEGREKTDNNNQVKRNADGSTQVDYYFAVAFAKTPGVQHWANEPWAGQIWQYGHSAWPQGQAGAPTFAWKIEDGDDQIPNKRGRKNCDKAGHPGHWIVKFSSGFPPNIVSKNAQGAWAQDTRPNLIMPGDFVEVLGSINSNGSTDSPGIYMNHNMVAFIGYSQEGRISFGPDANAVGFGSTPAPAGMTTVPPASAALPTTAPTPGNAAPPPPGLPAVAPTAPPAGVPPVPGPVPTPQPATPAVAPPPTSPTNVAPPPPPVPPNPAFTASAQVVLTAKAAGFTLQQLLDNGWTVESLRANGYAQ